MQNSNATVEGSIWNNKKTFRSERSSLSDESLMRLRRLKEYPRKCTWAENINTLDNGKIKEM